MEGVPAGVDCRTVGLGNQGRVVRAVVRNNKYFDQMRRVVLRIDAVDQLTDYRALIPCRNQHGKAMGRGFAVGFRLYEEGNGYVKKLIGIADKKQTDDEKIDQLNGLHDCSSFVSALQP